MNEHITQGSGDGLLVLAVDTSTAALAAALVRGGEVLREAQSLAERNHSVHTVSTVQSMLAECGVTPEQLDGIAIGRGPGSYTGMRIAVSLGKTLAWVWNKPLVGVSSLEAVAFGAVSGAVSDAASGVSSGVAEEPASTEGGQRPVWIVPIMDARRGQVYTAAFASHGASRAWRRLVDDGIRLMRDWVDQLAADIAAADAESRPVKLWITGELALHEAEAGRLAEICPGVEIGLLPSLLEGRAVAALGAKRLAAGESDDIHAFAPNYTQLTEAEVKLQEKQNEQNKQDKQNEQDKHAAPEGVAIDDAN